MKKGFSIMMFTEKRDIKPLFLKFGMALALSFAGYFYSRLRTKRIKPHLPPPPSPDQGVEVDSGGKTQRTDDLHAFPKTASSSSHVVSFTSERYEEDISMQRSSIDNSVGLSPSSRNSGDKDGFLLPEFNDLVKEFDFAAAGAGLSPKKDLVSPRSDVDTAKSFRSAEQEDYEQEIKNLRNIVRMLRERERNLEVQLLEYYGLREQETAVLELQNRLKINNMEAKLFTMKIESLQAENKRLEAQVSDHAKVVTELEAARSKVKHLKKKLRHDAEQNKEQILNLQERVARLQKHELKLAANDQDIQAKLERLRVLEGEAEELRKSNMRLQIENSELAEKLESTQILANSVLEDRETEALKEISNRLRQENENMTKEVEQLQADRCTDVEELVYLKWINACLRYELRNYQPPPGKTVARDLSKTLSPKSEEKAKQLILEYANTEGVGEKGLNTVDLDFDQWSSSQASSSYITDSGETDDTSIDYSSGARTLHASSKNKFLSKLRRLIRGKDYQHHHSRASSVGKNDPLEECDSPSGSSCTGVDTTPDLRSNQSGTPTQISSRVSLDFQRLRVLNLDDVKDVEKSQRNSDVSPSYRYKRFMMGRDDSPSPDMGVENQLDQDCKSDLVKFAGVLMDSRPRPLSRPRGMHKKSASFSFS